MSFRVLMRMHGGLAVRQTTNEEKETVLFPGFEKMFSDWQKQGIRLIGTFGNGAHVDDFAHYAIFEIDDLDLMKKMDSDFMSSDWAGMIENFELHLGWSRDFIDKHWA